MLTLPENYNHSHEVVPATRYDVDAEDIAEEKLMNKPKAITYLEYAVSFLYIVLAVFHFVLFILACILGFTGTSQRLCGRTVYGNVCVNLKNPELWIRGRVLAI